MADSSEQSPNEARKNPARRKRAALSLGLTVICLFVGYGFFKMNQRDWLNAIFFTVGLLGIMLSVLRRSR